MELEDKCLRVGAVVVGLAIVLRLFGGGVPETVARALTSQELTAALLFMETGRLVKPGNVPAETVSTQPSVPPQTDPTGPTTQPETVPETTAAVQPDLPVFGSEDVAAVAVNSVCGYDADVSGLLEKPLSWDLKADAPTVLILHSHGTESYKGTSGYRTTSNKKNVVAVGTALKKVLEEAGIQVVHDKTLHDSPSYSDAYGNARKSIEKYLKKYPTIALVLDIHRDSVTDDSGRQMTFRISEDGESVAQLMLVVGTDAGGLTHPDWQSNMALAVKLHAQLEKNTPGICRAISFRSQRFNQDLSPGALIVEVGAAGNTQKEALAAAERLGQAIIDLAGGTG